MCDKLSQNKEVDFTRKACFIAWRRYIVTYNLNENIQILNSFTAVP